MVEERLFKKYLLLLPKEISESDLLKTFEKIVDRVNDDDDLPF